MTLATTIIAWAALASVAVMSPGPDMLLVAGQAARRGFRSGLLAVAGILVGGLWYMLLCGFGFLSILTASPTAFGIVKLAGAAYLAWLGASLLIGAIRHLPAQTLEATVAARPFRQALVTNALNPKIAVFYLSALPQFVGTGADAPMVGVILIGVHYMLGGAWLSLVAAGASRAGGVARHSSARRLLEATLGTAFIGLAGKIAWERN